MGRGKERNTEGKEEVKRQREEGGGKKHCTEVSSKEIGEGMRKERYKGKGGTFQEIKLTIIQS